MTTPVSVAPFGLDAERRQHLLIMLLQMVLTTLSMAEVSGFWPGRDRQTARN